VRSHRLGVFERAAGLEIGGDAGRPEDVAAELDLETGLGRAPADHLIRVDAVHRVVRQPARLAYGRSEEGGLAGIADAGREPVAVSSHGQITGYFVGPDEDEEFKRFRESRRSFATAELPEEKFEAIRSSRMDPRHAHLDKLIDPK
jgi:hypothetical protein